MPGLELAGGDQSKAIRLLQRELFARCARGETGELAFIGFGRRGSLLVPWLGLTRRRDAVRLGVRVAGSGNFGHASTPEVRDDVRDRLTQAGGGSPGPGVVVGCLGRKQLGRRATRDETDEDRENGGPGGRPSRHAMGSPPRNDSARSLGLGTRNAHGAGSILAAPSGEESARAARWGWVGVRHER